MTALAPAKVGWCPGALRPMESGDGFIVRVKPRGGLVNLAAAIALARLAMRHGNGQLELTGRANLQIRGVRSAALPSLVQGLRGLGLLDATAEAEAVRNVVSSPLAGLDPSARMDIRPLAAAIESLLVGDETLWRLPAKWSVAVDDGGMHSLRDLRADLRLEALPDGVVAIGLGKAPAWATCAVDRTLPAVLSLCRRALAPEPVRMSALVAAQGAPALFAAAGLRPALRPLPERRPMVASDLVGWQKVGADAAYGIAAPFGHFEAADMVRLLAAARSAGATQVHLTPWRVMLLTGFGDTASGTLTPIMADAAAAFIADAADPRLAVAACAGLPACRRATTAVREDAAVLARTLPPTLRGGDIALHLSGCAKGCALPRSAPWTLVARDGLYDLVRDGKAGGVPVARGLTIQDAARRLSPALDSGQP